MQRGVLNLSKEEYAHLFHMLDIEEFVGTQLYEKLNSALQSTQEEIKILLSEDEIEKILDQIGLTTSDNPVHNSVMEKINTFMTSFRS